MWKKLFENIWLKLGALFLALLLWFHVTTDRSYEHTFSYPLEITNIPDNLIMYEEIPKEVKVLVEGKGKTLMRLFLSQEETFRIDGSKFKAKENHYQIKPEQISLPSEDLRVMTILSPKNLKIKLDYLMQRKVEVVSQIIIQPDEDFLLLEETILEPQEVVVEGPRRFVRLIKSVLTEPEALEGVRRSVSETVDLAQPKGFNVRCQPEKVSFSVNVQKGERREMSVRISESNRSSGKKIKIVPDRVSLTLLGERKRLDMLTPEDVKATLQLKNSRGKYKLSPKITVPSQVKLIQVTPDSVEVEIN